MTSSVDTVSSSKTDVIQQTHVAGGEAGGSSGNSLIEQMIYQMLLDSMQSTSPPATDTSNSGTGGSGQPAATQVNQIN